jgi:hypothetical protein
MRMILVHVHPLLLLCCGGITSVWKEILLVASVFLMVVLCTVTITNGLTVLRNTVIKDDESETLTQ